MLPPRTPIVIWTLRLLPVPAVTMQTIELPELHSVASHDEAPTRRTAVSRRPKLEPITVKLTDPVEAKFRVEFVDVGAGRPNAPRSTDQHAVKLPDETTPVVTTIRMVPCVNALPI